MSDTFVPPTKADLAKLNEDDLVARLPKGDVELAKYLDDNQVDLQRGKAEAETKHNTVLDALRVLLANEEEAEQTEKFNRWEWRCFKPLAEIYVKQGTLSDTAEKDAHGILKKFTDALYTFGINWSDLYPISRTATTTKEEFEPEIKAKALDILQNGDPVQYVADSCGKLVLGAEKAFKKLTCCIADQNVNQSAGLHPKLNGDSSGGKTHTVYTFAHHMPREAVIKGSMSAKAGFYHNDGARVLRILDDYQAGNEDLDTVIKQTSSEFHAEYTHRTVANHEAKTLTISSEQTWAITSVDSAQEIQVLNRQMPINVDDSVDLTIQVNNMTVKRYCNGDRQYPVTEAVLVSRCIIQTLRDEGYIDVRVPFGDRIEWLDTTNRRNPSIFMDLVVAYTSMFRYQREKDAEGFYLATEEDFGAARMLFTDKDGEELVKRFTKKERETLEFLVSRPSGITQDDLAEHLGVSRQRAGQIIYGQKGLGGLMQKVAIKEKDLSEMVRLSDDNSRTIRMKIYSLKDYDKFAGFDAVVRLKPQSDGSCKSRKDGASIRASTDTNTSKDHASNESMKEKEKEERENKRETQSSSFVESKVSRENEDRTCNTCTKEPDSDDRTCTKAFIDFHDPPDKPIDSENHTCTISAKRLCAKCGEDLTDKSSIEKNGETFCYQGGCSTPTRRKA